MFYSYKEQKDAIGKNLDKQMFFTGAAADIEVFDKKYIGQNFEKDKVGFFFTSCTAHEVVPMGVFEDPYSSGAYAKNASYFTNQPPVVYPVYLEMKNPLTVEDVISAYYLNPEDPFDGCHQQDFFDDKTEDLLRMVKENGNDSVFFDYNGEQFAVVFEPEQITFALLTA